MGDRRAKFKPKGQYNHGPGKGSVPHRSQHQRGQRGHTLSNIEKKSALNVGNMLSPALLSFCEAVVHPFGNGAVGATYPDNRQELVTGLTDRLELDLRPEDFNCPTAVDQRTSETVDYENAAGVLEQITVATFDNANWMNAKSDCQLTGVFMWLQPRCLASGNLRLPTYKIDGTVNSKFPEVPYYGLGGPNEEAPHFSEITTGDGFGRKADQTVLLDDYCLCFTGIWRCGGKALDTEIPIYYLNGTGPTAKQANPYLLAVDKLRSLWSSDENRNRPITYGFYQGANILLANFNQKLGGVTTGQRGADQAWSPRSEHIFNRLTDREKRRMSRVCSSNAAMKLEEKIEDELEDIEMCDKYSTMSINSSSTNAQGWNFRGDRNARQSQICGNPSEAGMGVKPIKKGTKPSDRENWSRMPLTKGLLQHLGISSNLDTITTGETAGLPEHPIASYYTAIRFARFTNIADNCSKMRLLGAGLKLWSEEAPINTGGYSIGGWLSIEDIYESIAWETEGADNNPGYYPYPANPSGLANIQSKIRFPCRSPGVEGCTVRYSPLQDVFQLKSGFPTMPSRLYSRTMPALVANSLTPPAVFKNAGSDPTNPESVMPWTLDTVLGSGVSDMNKGDQIDPGSYVPVIYWSFNAKDEEVTEIDENGNARLLVRPADDGIYTLKLMAVAHSEGTPNGSSPFQSHQSDVDPLHTYMKVMCENVDQFPVAATGHSFKSFLRKAGRSVNRFVKHHGGYKKFLDGAMDLGMKAAMAL